MTKLNERIVEWHYAHDADITLGELHVSKTAKILLISLICVLLVAIGLGIYFRGYIYDYIVQPSVELKENSIDLEVFSEFDPNDYISKNSEYLQDINSNVDMSTLGTYQVVYTSKNRIKTIESVLTVNVVDTTDPELILLNDGVLIAVKNSEELQNFNPQDYIVYCHDNYDPNPQIEYTTPNPKLFTEEGQVNITYSCVDSSGNQTSAVLTVVVQEDFASQIQDSEKSQEEIDKLQKQLEEQQKQLEEQQKQIDEQKKELEEKQKPTPTPSVDPGKTTPTPTEPKQTGTSEPKQTNTTEPTQTQTNPPSGNQPHLTAYSATVYIGDDPEGILAILVSKIDCYGDIGPVSPSSDNIKSIQNAMNKGTEGDYTVYWSSAGGSEGQFSATQTVHVKSRS